MPAAHESPTQAQRILDRLMQTPGQWVAMPELWEVSGAFAVHSRVSELRGHGHCIEVEISGSRPRISRYRIVLPTNEPAPQYARPTTLL